jgi:RsiW-degrading membrane proteinase PrsW (M82 family)
MGNYFQVSGSVVLASIPALIWGYIFLKKNPEKRYFTAITFIAGALAVLPILIYKFSWRFFPWMNAFNFASRYSEDVIGFSSLIVLPLSVVITFMIVGIIEEVMKLIAVKSTSEIEIKTIDDSIEFFIIAALGFSFAENILYFQNIWATKGITDLVIPFLFRSSFSTFAHLLFSGVLGYYYGLARFAKPILQEELSRNKSSIFMKIQRIFGFKKEKIFYRAKLAEGLVIAIGMHALFNIFLEMGVSFMIVPFLFGGYMALNYLFEKKENHKNYGQVYAFEPKTIHLGNNVYFKQTPIRNDI